MVNSFLLVILTTLRCAQSYSPGVKEMQINHDGMKNETILKRTETPEDLSSQRTLMGP